MSFKTALAAAAAAAAAALSAASVSAASIDLEALGLSKGPLIAETDAALIDFFALTGDLIGIDLGGLGNLTASAADPEDATLTLFSPDFFEGQVVTYDIDADHAVGLFFDGATYVLAEASAPGGSAFDFSSDFNFTGSAAVYEVAPIPLPAAAPMLLLGLAGFAALRSRRA